MKNKKGFTLIELLAVIVILAIIALIATPLVLKYIEKSRQEAAKASVLSYVSAIETEVAASQLKNKIYQDKTNYNFDEIVVSVKGTKPTKGTYSLKKGIIESGNFCINGYNVDYTINGAKVNGTCDGKGNDSNDVQGEVVFEQNAEAIYESEVEAYGLEIEFDASKFVEGAIYELVIDNNEAVQLIAYVDSNIFLMNTNEENTIIYLMKNENKLTGFIVTEKVKKDGTYNVKLSLKNDNYIYQSVIIKNRYLEILTPDLFEGKVNVKIFDNDGTIYFDKNLQAYDLGTFYKVGDYPDNFNAYQAIKDGKILTVTLTGIVDGNEVTKTLGGSEFTYVAESFNKMGCGEEDYYYWGSHDVERATC